MNLKAGLYLVSTPIGNLNDITIRAIETLKSSNIILCEDTRISRKLLAEHSITTNLSVYNDKSNESVRKSIAKNIASGQIISLISDAGTPLISDPGYKLLGYLKKRNYFVDIVPGVSSPIAALSISGLPPNRFMFVGFLPKTNLAKEKIFMELESLNSTLIFFESPLRILSSLKVALKILGDRKANIARELTKLFQESKTDKISSLIDYYTSNKPKGEVVLLISGKKSINVSEREIVKEIQELLLSNKETSAKTITEIVFSKYHKSYSKRQLYQICNSLKNNIN